MSTVADDARQVLQAAIDAKVAAVEAYATAQTARTDAAAQLHAAETAEADAWAQLKRLDWSDTELKTIGLNPPNGASTKRPAGRSRKRQASTDSSTHQS